MLKPLTRYWASYSLIVIFSLIFAVYIYILGDDVLDPGDGILHF